MSNKYLIAVGALILILLTFYGYKKYFSGGEGVKTAPIVQTVRQVNITPVVTSSPSTGVTDIKSGLTLNVTTPSDNSTVANANIIVTGTTSPGADVFVNETELKADATGKFSSNVTLEEGTNLITVVANDSVGNYAEKDLSVTLESTQ